MCPVPLLSGLLLLALRAHHEPCASPLRSTSPGSTCPSCHRASPLRSTSPGSTCPSCAPCLSSQVYFSWLYVPIMSPVPLLSGLLLLALRAHHVIVPLLLGLLLLALRAHHVPRASPLRSTSPGSTCPSCAACLSSQVYFSWLYVPIMCHVPLLSGLLLLALRAHHVTRASPLRSTSPGSTCPSCDTCLSSQVYFSWLYVPIMCPVPLLSGLLLLALRAHHVPRASPLRSTSPGSTCPSCAACLSSQVYFSWLYVPIMCHVPLLSGLLLLALRAHHVTRASPLRSTSPGSTCPSCDTCLSSQVYFSWLYVPIMCRVPLLSGLLLLALRAHHVPRASPLRSTSPGSTCPSCDTCLSSQVYFSWLYVPIMCRVPLLSGLLLLALRAHYVPRASPLRSTSPGSTCPSCAACLSSQVYFSWLYVPIMCPVPLLSGLLLLALRAHHVHRASPLRSTSPGSTCPS